MDIYLDCVHVLAITNNAEIDIGVHLFEVVIFSKINIQK